MDAQVAVVTSSSSQTGYMKQFQTAFMLLHSSNFYFPPRSTYTALIDKLPILPSSQGSIHPNCKWLCIVYSNRFKPFQKYASHQLGGRLSQEGMQQTMGQKTRSPSEHPIKVFKIDQTLGCLLIIPKKLQTEVGFDMFWPTSTAVFIYLAFSLPNRFLWAHYVPLLLLFLGDLRHLSHLGWRPQGFLFLRTELAKRLGCALRSQEQKASVKVKWKPLLGRSKSL